MAKEKIIYTPIEEVALKRGEHVRTMSSRLERAGYEGVYIGKKLCFHMDENAWKVVSQPVRRRHGAINKVARQQELPLEMPTKNDETEAEVKTDEKVAEHHGPCFITAIESKCENCKFFRLSLKDLNGIFGECRIHAPVMSLQKDGSYKQMCPMVSKDDSCGDFTP